MILNTRDANSPSDSRLQPSALLSPLTRVSTRSEGDSWAFFSGLTLEGLVSYQFLDFIYIPDYSRAALHHRLLSELFTRPSIYNYQQNCLEIEKIKKVEN